MFSRDELEAQRLGGGDREELGVTKRGATALMLCVLAGVLITLTGLVETGVVHGAQVADGQHHQAVITTGVIAGVFSIHALWCLLLLGMGRRRWLGGWPGAVASYSAALLALFAAIIAVVANVGFG